MALQKIPSVQIIPLGLQMIANGINIGVFKEENSQLEIDRHIQVTFEPPIQSWQPRSARKKATRNNEPLR